MPTAASKKKKIAKPSMITIRKGSNVGTSEDMARSVMSIGDLTQDPKNCRRHNPRNIGSIVNSLGKVGAARSIVIDENNMILAGNGLVEAAGEAGITNLKIVDADGETVVAVRRTGLTDKQKAELAIADNRTAELAEWDAEQLLKTIAEYEIDPKAVEFTEEELERLAAGPIDFGEAPESVRENVEALEKMKGQRKEGNENIANKNDTEKYLVIVYPTRDAKQAALKKLGLPLDERYVSSTAVIISGMPQPIKTEGRSAKAANPNKSGRAG